jgi:hypothetical protein
MNSELIYFLIGVLVAFVKIPEKGTIIGKTYIFIFTVALWPMVVIHDAMEKLLIKNHRNKSIK